MFKLLNGKMVEMTSDEITEYLAEKQLREEESAIADKIDKLASPISMAQCRIQLSRNSVTTPDGIVSLLTIVEQYISNSKNEELKISWEYATKLSRRHPLFTEAAVVLGLTPEEIDDLYLSALSIDIV